MRLCRCSTEVQEVNDWRGVVLHGIVCVCVCVCVWVWVCV